MLDAISGLNAALEGRYRIERELGAGGMGTVYLATDLRHDRSVALKVLKPELAASVGGERFLAEVRTTAKLQHPHLVPLFDSGEAAGHLFYVMPFLEGESVRDRIDREGPLPVDDAVRIASECAGALEYAHRQGVVHRDIKPANVLLSDGHAVIADFGIATAVHASADRKALTGSGVSVGSVGYMSPEQMAGDAPVDARADVFALGCVLHEMLSGERLFRGATPQAVFARQLDGPESVTKVRSSVPVAVEDVITRACAATAGDRFQSAGDFGQALKAAGPGGEASAGSTASSASAAEPKSSGRKWSGLLPLAGAAAIVLAGVAIWMASGQAGDPTMGDATGAGAGSVTDTDPLIAVLPFEDLAATTEYETFVDGVHLTLIDQLSKIDGLTVLPRMAVVDLGASRSVAEIASALGADFLLMGSVQRAASRIRLNLDLFDPDVVQPIWESEYDTLLTIETLFDVQEDIARNAAREMSVTLSPEEERSLAARETKSLEAYDLFSAGRSAYTNRGPTDDSLVVAVARYRQGLEIDSEYALAYAGIADAFAQGVCCYSYSLEWVDSAFTYARRALEIDPALTLGHNAMGKAYGGYEQRDSSIAAYERSLAINPEDAQALNNVAFAYRLSGEIAIAAQYAYRSIRLFPTSRNPSQNTANSYAQLGLDERALEFWADAQALGLNSPAPEEHRWADPARHLEDWRAAFRTGGIVGEGNHIPAAAVLLYLAGVHDEAVPRLEQAYRADPGGQLRRSPHHTLTALGLALWLSGDEARASDYMAQAIVRVNERIAAGGSHWQYPFDLAAIHAVRGEIDEALEWLDQAYEFGFRSRGLARSDPALESLRSDPRFDAWFARIEADIQEQRARLLEWERAVGIGVP